LIRDLVRHINSSPSRVQAFNKIAERECLDTKAGLVLDIPNRWNSTYAMILEAVKYKIVLKRYATSQQQPFPTEVEWNKAESIGKFLGVFEETTTLPNLTFVSYQCALYTSTFKKSCMAR